MIFCARRICAVLGVAVAAGAVIFTSSLIRTNNQQSVRRAEKLLSVCPVGPEESSCAFQLDYRPQGRVMQGPPMRVLVATKKGVDGIVFSKSVFTRRGNGELPAKGERIKLIGRKGAYLVKIAGFIDSELSAPVYPNAFVSPETRLLLDEKWEKCPSFTAEDLAPYFETDTQSNMSRAKWMLLWAAALTALCILVNTLFLSVESRRREIAFLRSLGMSKFSVCMAVAKEAAFLSCAGFAFGFVLAVIALYFYVLADKTSFPMGMALDFAAVAYVFGAAFCIALTASLLALRPALSVRPMELVSYRRARRKRLGMFIAFSFGFGAFVAVEVWGVSLTKPFLPSPEWPDAIVSMLPAGVSAGRIAELSALEGVERLSRLDSLQVNFYPLEKLHSRGKRVRSPKRPEYRNALLLSGGFFPDFKFVEGNRAAALSEMSNSRACVITEMMARSRSLGLGDKLQLSISESETLSLKVAGIVRLNWHMVTSRALLRGRNMMPVNTDGPVFVSKETLACFKSRRGNKDFVTHIWLDFKKPFLEELGAFAAGRRVERSITEVLEKNAPLHTRGNAIRLHSRDEISDGTLSHSADLVGAMARVPFIFVAVVSLGFIAMLVSSFESRKEDFRILRTVGASKSALQMILVREALEVSLSAIAFSMLIGSAVGWLCTWATRSAMSNWALPATFAVPFYILALGAVVAVGISLIVAIPASFFIVSRRV